MPEFNLYAGAGASPQALAQLLVASVEAAQSAAQTKARGYAQGAELALRGVESALAGYLRGQDREAEARRQRSYQAFQAEENQLARQAAEERQESEQRFQSGRDVFGAGADYLRQSRDISARRELAQMAQQEAQRQEMAKQQAEAAQRQQQDQALLAATTYAQSPEGSKALYMEFEPTGFEALGIAGLPQSVVEERVKSLFPDTRPIPAVGEGEKADRSALDAKLKELKQKFYVQVPNEIVFQQRLSELTQLYGAEAAIAAMKEVKPPSGVGGARGLRSGYEVALEHVRGILGQTKAAGYPPQVQGGIQDVIGLFQEQQGAAEAVAPPQEARFTTQFLQGIGAELDQLDKKILVAASLGYPMAVEGDRIVLQEDALKDPAGPIPPPKGAQEKLDRFFERNPRLKAQAMAVLGHPEQSRTPSEVREMGAVRALSDRAPARDSGGGAPESENAGRAPSSPGLDALEQYRARVKRELGRTSAPPPVPRRPIGPVPRSISLVGRNLNELAKLLSGAGGRP